MFDTNFKIGFKIQFFCLESLIQQKIQQKQLFTLKSAFFDVIVINPSFFDE
jgi:hypothetical protein